MREFILVIGNFGDKNRLNGQTARTRTIYSSLQSNEKIRVKTVDTRKKNLLMLIKLVFGVRRAKKIVAMPAQRSLGFISSIISLFHSEKKTIYVVIGGWLPEYLCESSLLKKRVRDFQVLLVQTNGIKKKLSQIGIDNVKVFPNYRIVNGEYNKNDNYANDEIVFYSRIREDKGATIAIDFINKYNNNFRNKKTTIDFYGPIDDDYKDTFYKKIGNNENIHYKGILRQSKTIETLRNYRFMFFPTFYEGEGFPGAVLESYMAGLPVLASDWRYNKEVVRDNKTGMVFKLDDPSDLNYKFSKMIGDDVLIEKMRTMCYCESLKYSEKNVYKTLHNELMKVNK